MKTKPGGIFIAAGSNLEDRAGHILGGLRDLEAEGDVIVLQRSTLREYPPVGGPAQQPFYLNAVAELSTSLSPQELLARLHAVEARHGRVRHERHGPRTLDLDLLLYHDQVILSDELMVPHPRMLERAFVLDPLRELAGADVVEFVRGLLTAAEAKPEDGAGGPAPDATDATDTTLMAASIAPATESVATGRGGERPALRTAPARGKTAHAR
ncbi:MAG: 2-amino-4-hydroxy-6-hydroxymethyldihydropteridine diphosphokinase [Phycisphaerae bacterium]|nr:2-amino-4-hydroxy-6-hydroxymethyldihydropteridine diphosphokinase [Phycisphaerae bacterium]